MNPKELGYLSLGLLLLSAGGCASRYTVLERSMLEISANSRTVARTLLPLGDRHPALIEHLALAEEVYEKQLGLLRQRRTKTRARRRDLNFASYAVLAGGALGVGGVAIGGVATGADHAQALVGTGALSLVGVGVGTALQIAAAMQEEPAVADDKLRGLQRAYESMLERVRLLSQRVTDDRAEAAQVQAQISAAIESFISEAMQINVKG